MNDLISISVAIILGVFAIISGSLEFFERMGFPTPLQKQRDQKNRKIVISTLEEVGLLEHRSEIQQFRDFARFKKRVPVSYSTQALDDIICKYTKKVNHVQIGLFDKTEIKYQIDLVTALSHPEDGRTLTRMMCRQIIDTMSNFSVGTPLFFDRIAISKSGNTGLGLRVAIELEKPWVFVDVRGGIISSETIEGEIKPNEEIIIIHDVLASGRLIEVCAQELAKKQAKIKHVFVLIESTDRLNTSSPIPSKLLERSGIKLHALLSLNEYELENKFRRDNQ